MPDGGVGLDGEPLVNGGHRRLHLARRIIREWHEWASEKERDGGIAPTRMTPHQFIDWFEREEIETEWLPLFIDVIVGKPSAGQVDFIPVQVAEYAAQSMAIVDSMRAVLDGAAPSALPVSIPKVRVSPHAAHRDPGQTSQKDEEHANSSEDDSDRFVMERQIRAIEDGADAMGFNRKAIPWRGKKALLAWCLENHPNLFESTGKDGASKFKEAWKEASRRQRITHKYRNTYADRK